MFLQVIDGSLIDVFQWMVRQAELLTNLTRMCLIQFFIKLAAACLGIAYGSLLYAVGFRDPDPLLVLGGNVVFAFYVVDLLAVQVASHRSAPKEMLPVAIVERQLVRRVVMLSTLSLSIGNVATLVVFLWPSSLVYWINWVVLIAMTLGPISVFVLEYLICTTSLPPGEKERRKQERELRKLAPQGV